MTPVIREETGNDPEIEFFDAPIVVDNLTGETLIYGSLGFGQKNTAEAAVFGLCD